ncbi:MAG: hypothetical protein AB7P02_01990 [Alphaproteobacteria bacterium]
MTVRAVCAVQGEDAAARDCLARLEEVARALTDPPEFARVADGERATLPERLPGYDVYLSVAPDMRVLRPEALRLHLLYGRRRDRTFVAVPESDPAYVTAADPALARAAAAVRRARLAAAFGADIADRQLLLPRFDAGIVTGRADSPIWRAWRERAEQAPTDDAFDVAALDVEGWFRMPTTMGWLCGLRLPWRAPDGTWRHPEHRPEPIYAARLSPPLPAMVAVTGAALVTEAYRAIGLTQ